jgi:hypothetical protein
MAKVASLWFDEDIDCLLIVQRIRANPGCLSLKPKSSCIYPCLYLQPSLCSIPIPPTFCVMLGTDSTDKMHLISLGGSHIATVPLNMPFYARPCIIYHLPNLRCLEGTHHRNHFCLWRNLETEVNQSQVIREGRFVVKQCVMSPSLGDSQERTANITKDSFPFSKHQP